MYILIKTGVYIQDIIGVFNDKQVILDVGIKCIKAEKDDYHRFKIFEIQPDVIYKDSFDSGYTNFIVAEISRTGKTVIIKTKQDLLDEVTKERAAKEKEQADFNRLEKFMRDNKFIMPDLLDKLFS